MADPFPTTRWSLVLAARDEDQASAALADLCRDYWFPLYAYARRHGRSIDEAADVVQDCFVRILEQHALDAVSPEGGRFRRFLLHKLKQSLIDGRRKEQADKRGAGFTLEPLETAHAETRYVHAAAGERSPESEFDRQWADTLLRRALGSLRQGAAGRDQSDLFERIHPFLLQDPKPGRYAQIAEETGRTQSAVKVAVHRLRVRFGDLLRKQIRDTVDSDDKVEGELRYLLSTLRT